MKNTKIHPTAEVSTDAKIGDNVKIWHHVQIREDAIIGDNCILGKNTYVDKDVKIGANVKIGNNVSLFYGVTIEDGVQVGPHVCFVNDKLPRAINPDGSLKETSDWAISKTLIKEGASLGANSTIVCGNVVGKFALVGAGSVVTKDIPDYGLAYGNPVRLRGYVCKCGEKVELKDGFLECKRCNEKIEVKNGV